MITIDQFRDAQAVLEKAAQRTAILPAHALSNARRLFLKAENLQNTGSFKLRGAYYKISRLSDAEKARGVVACSAGNHAQGVALAARREGIKSVICMPERTPISKVNRTGKLGAEIVLVKGVYDDAYRRALELAETEGYTLVHPFDDIDVITGQGTIGMELYEQYPRIETVFVPVGGGGLIAGVACALKQLNPDIQIVGVEAENAASMKASIGAGYIQRLQNVATIADGIAVKEVGETTFEMCKKYVDGFVTVNESEIASAILQLLEDYKLITEGAGAVAVAAAMYGKWDVTGKNVACILSGGNVDINMINRIIMKGLKKSGRLIEVETVLDDKPGQLQQLCSVLTGIDANIAEIHYDRDHIDYDIGKCVVDIIIETKGPEHADQIVTSLEENGYLLCNKV